MPITGIPSSTKFEANIHRCSDFDNEVIGPQGLLAIRRTACWREWLRTHRKTRKNTGSYRRRVVGRNLLGDLNEGAVGTERHVQGKSGLGKFGSIRCHQRIGQRRLPQGQELLDFRGAAGPAGSGLSRCHAVSCQRRSASRAPLLSNWSIRSMRWRRPEVRSSTVSFWARKAAYSSSTPFSTVHSGLKSVRVFAILSQFTR